MNIEQSKQIISPPTPNTVLQGDCVEVRRRTRPMVLFNNVQSVERIIYAIFSRFNEDWKNHTLALFIQAA